MSSFMRIIDALTDHQHMLAMITLLLSASRLFVLTSIRSIDISHYFLCDAQYPYRLWNDVDCETKGFFFVAEFGKRYQQSATAWPVVKPEHAARVNREHAEKRKNKSPAHDEL